MVMPVPAQSTRPTDSAPTILLIDDDVELSQMLCEYFDSFGCPLRLAHTSREGEALLAGGDYDLALLDLMLPDGSGLDLLRRHRDRCGRPVIMLTAHGDESDRVVGLELGADDYLAKPFSPRELKARIHAVLRRCGAVPGAPRADRLECAGIVLDPRSGRASVAKAALDLTGAEARVLEILMRSPGQVVPREHIGQFALGRTPGRFDRSIDTHISSLRRKLQQAAASGTQVEAQIRNLRGRGYALMALTAL